jgi:hypothetical protein
MERGTRGDLLPRRWLQGSAQGFNLVSTLGFIHNLEGTADNWKTSLGAKEHRLEAYATLVFRTVERSLRAIPVAIAVNPRWGRYGVNVA